MLSVFMCFLMKIVSSSLNAMLIVDKHCSGICCDEFPMPQTDRISKQVTEHSDTKKIFGNQYGEELTILDT